MSNASSVTSNDSFHAMPVHAPVDITDQVTRARAERQELVSIISRLKRQVESRKTVVRELRAKVERVKQESAEYRKEVEDREEELEEKQEELQKTRKEMHQYRNWWISEVQFTKILCDKIPEPNRDMELVRGSKSQYFGRY